MVQTRLVPEALDHSLRRIDEQARTALEEQGVNTLFLTLGMLRFFVKNLENIQGDERDAIFLSITYKRIEGRGSFLWRADGGCRVRSRLNTGISGDRIAPQEIAAAVELVFAERHAFQRQALITETRAVLGYSRTGPVLEETIGRVLDDLLSRGTLGQASEGIVLRAGRISEAETDRVPAE